MTDVALVMVVIFLLFYFSFCFVLRIVVLKEYRVFSLFSLKSQQLSINHRSVTQDEKIILQCIFVTGIYLLVICMIVSFFCLLLSCGDISDSKRRSELSLPLLLCKKDKLLY